METKIFYTYILSNKGNTVLYVGFTGDLKQRLKKHINPSSKGFTSKYNVTKLVWFETTQHVNNAIQKEKQIKKWNREWKENLINDKNPGWNDLSWMIE